MDNLSLSQMVEKHLKVMKGNPLFFDIMDECIIYIARGTTSYEFQHNINKIFPRKKGVPSAKEFRLFLTERGYSLNIRFYTLNLAKVDANAEQAAKLAKIFHMKKTDAIYIYKRFKKDILFRRNLRETANLVDKSLIDYQAYAKINKDFISLKPKLIKYINYKVRSKLSFLINSTNTHFSDFQSDLLVIALKTYYSLIPTKEPDYKILAYLKKTIHCKTINIIKSEQSKKKCRIVGIGNKEKGFESVQMVVTESEMSPNSIIEFKDVQLECNQEKDDLEWSVQQLLTRHKNAPKKLQLIKLLMGNYDSKFSDFLRKKGYSKHESNVSIQMKIDPYEFNNLLSEYLEVQEKQLNRFILRLQIMLGYQEPKV